MELIIDQNNIEQSFERIANYLLLSSVICVNDIEVEITEIEFYYFKKDIHEDNYTHPHNRDAGEWRLHNQGIDITFEGNETTDGGILIRGIKHGNEYINGPLKTLSYLFKLMGKVQAPGTFYLKEKVLNKTQLFKTFRHIPNKVQYEEFHLKNY